MNTNVGKHVEFVSYTGEYPNLCRGVLTLKIDGEEVVFGHNYCFNDWKNDGHYNDFWSSGGSCGFSDDYSQSYVTGGEWEIDVLRLPENYRKYAHEIDQVFNENVESGCCGGCL